MSKARQPTTPAAAPTKTTPAKSTAATRGATPAARGGATVKPRVGLAGAKLKDGKTKVAPASATGAAATKAAKGPKRHDEAAAPQEVADDIFASHEQDGSRETLSDEPEHVEHHEPEDMIEGEGHEANQASEEHYVEEPIAEPETTAHEEAAEEHSPVETEEAASDSHTDTADDTPAASSEAEVEAEAEAVVSEAEAEPDAAHSEAETHVDTESDTVAGSVVADKSGNDIEDMVAFLEAASVKPRPTSVIVPDEVADIPDED